MTNTLISSASNGHKVNETEQSWELLSDKEKLVLLAMLISKNDTDAINNSPIKRTQFYAYKTKLEPIKNELTASLLDKALEILQGSSLEAANVLRDQLKHNNPRIRQDAAESILDRTIGRSFIAEQQKILNQTVNFHLIGVEQSKIDRLFTPKEY